MTPILIGYARCSTDKQDLAAQQEALRQLGVAPDRIYANRGFTGTNRARPGLDQALAAVRGGGLISKFRTLPATIGPLPRGTSGANMTATYLQAATSPGFQTDIHPLAGPEALYILSGEVCVETPQGKRVGRAGGKPLLIAGGQPMQLTSTGTETRRSFVLVAHDSTRSWKIPASGWTPKGLCADS